MGWTYYATYGNINRLDECRRHFGEQPSWATIVKDALVGTTYYAAMKDAKTNEIWALVVLTDIDNGEFGYKDMSEDMLPYYFECPIKILELLSPTDCENAIEWRRHCYAYHGVSVVTVITEKKK